MEEQFIYCYILIVTPFSDFSFLDFNSVRLGYAVALLVETLLYKSLLGGGGLKGGRCMG